jgi:predicted glycogen debranching enzyme
MPPSPSPASQPVPLFSRAGPAVAPGPQAPPAGGPQGSAPAAAGQGGVAPAGFDPESLARTEWLLTNGLGGFAMGTALGVMSRRYHGLLVAPLKPPVQRVMTLSAVADSAILAPASEREQRFDLSTFRFRPGVLHPHGFANLVKFEKDSTVRWHYRLGPASLVKELVLFRGVNAAAIRYRVQTAGQPLRLTLRPLTAMRDFHALILRDTTFGKYHVEHTPSGCLVRQAGATLHLKAVSTSGTLVAAGEEQWWYDFQYDLERERGYDYLEDLFQPCAITWDVPAGVASAELVLHASLDGETRDVQAAIEHRRSRFAALADSTRGVSKLPVLPAAAAALVAASDDFIVRRAANPDAGAIGRGDRVSVIAGYPWFADWGRDSMIALPGLLLSTGRFDEARDVLLTFATHRKQGLIPNVFDDYTGQAHYNTVDASLWFVHAAGQYLKATQDAVTFKNDLLPACVDILEAYRRGTSFGIAMDPGDGLITSGDAGTQLTWMDAKRDGVAFTPRHGKAVEINALWYNALAWLAEAGVGLAGAAEYASLRDRVGASFRRLFWNAEKSRCFDTLQPDGAGWRPIDEGRPNQLIAVSLPNSPLDAAQRAGVVAFAKTALLTPMGVRTLEPGHPRYQGRYRGTMFQRDSAYHNGTAWPWLLGPLAEAMLRVGGFSPAAKAEARAALAPILARLDAECPGQLPEVADGDSSPDDPQRPGGCPAQAWSVAEVLRVFLLAQ